MRIGWSNNAIFLRERELSDGGDSFNLSEMEIYQVEEMN